MLRRHIVGSEHFVLFATNLRPLNPYHNNFSWQDRTKNLLFVQLVMITILQQSVSSVGSTIFLEYGKDKVLLYG